MRIEFASILLLSTTLPVSRAQDSDSNCNYVHLVQCFIDILDDWAWTLYELKDGLLTANATQCDHLRKLERCIDDKWDKEHFCKHEEVIEASNTVSDLLVRRRHSGSFLRSYYLLKYVCSVEGQKIVTQHRECLTDEKVAEMILSAGTYLSERFLENSQLDDGYVCDAVNDKLKEYVSAVSNLDKCPNEAAHLMCTSLVDMFKGLHSDKLQECDVIHCSLPPKEEAETSKEDSSEAPAEPGNQDGLQGTAEASTLAVSSVFSLLLPLLALR